MRHLTNSVFLSVVGWGGLLTCLDKGAVSGRPPVISIIQETRSTNTRSRVEERSWEKKKSQDTCNLSFSSSDLSDSGFSSPHFTSAGHTLFLSFCRIKFQLKAQSQKRFHDLMFSFHVIKNFLNKSQMHLVPVFLFIWVNVKLLSPSVKLHFALFHFAFILALSLQPFPFLILLIVCHQTFCLSEKIKTSTTKVFVYGFYRSEFSVCHLQWPVSDFSVGCKLREARRNQLHVSRQLNGQRRRSCMIPPAALG